MIKRVLFIWAIANFGLVGMASLIVGDWYLGWNAAPAVRSAVELVLIMIPNLVLPVLVLKYWNSSPEQSVREVLGWQWNSWRSILIGVLAFLIFYILLQASVRFLGESIPYNLPGESSTGGGIAIHSLSDAFLLLGILLGLVVLMGVTVAGEETMFRGWIQGQFGQRYGLWAGLLGGMLLFGLRHLPADIFYARAWHATPQMWLSRQVQLYLLALFLALARYFGSSTYASAITHALVLFVAIFGLG